MELLQSGLPFLSNPTHLEFGLSSGFCKVLENKQDGRSLNMLYWENRFESLTFQNRMHDELARIPRECFYNNKNMLTSSSYKKNLLLDDLLFTGETSPAYWLYEELKNKTRTNDNECNAVIETLRVIAKSKNYDNQSIIILCFYKDQLNLISKSIRQAGQSLNIIMGTVDSIQGQEADIVLLCFTKLHSNSFYTQPNRLNVALTRAKHKLYLFGPKEDFKLSKIPALVKLSEHPSKPHVSNGK